MPFKKIPSIIISLSLLIFLGITSAAMASVTISGTSIIGDSAFNTITGANSTTIDVGTGKTLSLQITNNGPITTGSGLFTFGGGATFGGDINLGSNNIFSSGSFGSTTARIAKGWFTDLQVTNPIAASITGSAQTATNLLGGLGGSLPYQSASGTTAMLANGTSGQLLQSTGSTTAPTWATISLTGSATTGTCALTATTSTITLNETSCAGGTVSGSAPFTIFEINGNNQSVVGITISTWSQMPHSINLTQGGSTVTTWTFPGSFAPTPSVYPAVGVRTPITGYYDGTTFFDFVAGGNTSGIGYSAETAAPTCVAGVLPPSGYSLLWVDSTDHAVHSYDTSCNKYSYVRTGVDVNTTNGQVTSTHLSSPLPINQGGTGTTTASVGAVSSVNGATGTVVLTTTGTANQIVVTGGTGTTSTLSLDPNITLPGNITVSSTVGSLSDQPYAPIFNNSDATDRLTSNGAMQYFSMNSNAAQIPAGTLVAGKKLRIHYLVDAVEGVTLSAATLRPVLCQNAGCASGIVLPLVTSSNSNICNNNTICAQDLEVDCVGTSAASASSTIVCGPTSGRIMSNSATNVQSGVISGLPTNAILYVNFGYNQATQAGNTLSMLANWASWDQF